MWSVLDSLPTLLGFGVLGEQQRASFTRRVWGRK